MTFTRLTPTLPVAVRETCGLGGAPLHQGEQWRGKIASKRSAGALDGHRRGYIVEVFFIPGHYSDVLGLRCFSVL